MKASGDGTYSGGKIWAPDRDKTYNSKMALSGDTLTVSGCVIGICRDQDWQRVESTRCTGRARGRRARASGWALRLNRPHRP